VIASGRELMMMLPCASFSMRWCQSLKLRHPRLPATASATTPNVPEQDGRGSGSCRPVRPIRFQSTITANETKIGLHLRFQRLVPFNEQSVASESFPQHFEKSLHRLNIYENRLYKFARDWTFESHDCARTQAAIAQA